MINGKHGQILTVPKWVLMNWPKIPKMPQNLSAQIVCPSPKFWNFDEKWLHWVSLVYARGNNKFWLKNLIKARRQWSMFRLNASIESVNFKRLSAFKVNQQLLKNYQHWEPSADASKVQIFGEGHERWKISSSEFFSC